MISLTNIKDLAAIIQSLVTVLAIVIGGVWTYFLFVRTRQRYPRLKITHQISHWAVNHEKAVLSVSIVISNIGNVLIPIKSGTIQVSQSPVVDVLSNIPVGRRVVIWPEIIRFQPADEQSTYVMEPGEDQQFFYHFIIDAQAPMILVKTFFPNTVRRRTNLFWGLTTIYYLQSSNQDSSKSKLTTENVLTLSPSNIRNHFLS